MIYIFLENSQITVDFYIFKIKSYNLMDILKNLHIMQLHHFSFMMLYETYFLILSGPESIIMKITAGAMVYLRFLSLFKKRI